jgi:hypothetical protein
MKKATLIRVIAIFGLAAIIFGAIMPAFAF